jgi:putative membrane protein
LIHRFRDHAANERTYLAWVRTVLALAGFGILIDKLAPPGTTATWFAPLLVGLSALLTVATVRFQVVRRMIVEDADDSPGCIWSERLPATVVTLLLLVVLVFLVGIV